jgi:hypothetical protein
MSLATDEPPLCDEFVDLSANWWLPSVPFKRKLSNPSRSMHLTQGRPVLGTLYDRTCVSSARRQSSADLSLCLQSTLPRVLCCFMYDAEINILILFCIILVYL